MHWLAHIIRATLLTLLMITPWLFGGVWARVQWMLMLVAAMLLAADLMTRFGEDDRPNLLPSAWLPPLAGIILGLFQLVAWPESLATVLAPGAVQWRAELAQPAERSTADSDQPLDSAGSAAAGGTPTISLFPAQRSLYAAATREQLALLTLVLSVFVLSSIYFVDRQSVVWFCAATVICGTLLTFFGLIQRLSWNGKFYWVFEPLEGSVQSFGPYVNRNNAGGLLNLCVAAGIGLLVWVHRRPSGERRSTSPSRRRDERGSWHDSVHSGDRRRESFVAASYPQSYESTESRATRLSLVRFRQLVSDYLAELTARRLWALLLVGFTVGGVLSTASRGSILALFSAAMITSVAMALQRGSRRYAIGLLAGMVAGLGMMSWAGQSAFVRERLALLFDPAQLEQGRIPNWLDALRGVPQFPFAGSGLGSYPFVYERFQRRDLPDTIHLHAENQYVQTLVEGGLIGEVLLLAAIVLVAMAIWRLFRAGGTVNSVLAIAGTFGLTSQVVGGAFDFGLYLPANALLMAALCGMIVGRAALLSVWPPEALQALDRPAPSSKFVVRSATELPEIAHQPLTDDRRMVMGAAHSRRHWHARPLSLAASRSPALGLAVPSAVVALLVGFLLLGCLSGSLEMSRAARIETARRRANLARLQPADLRRELPRYAAPLIAALPQRWDDAQAHEHLALVYLLQYQAETYRQLAGGSTDEDRPLDAQLWARTSLPQLHRTLRQLESAGDDQGAESLRQSPAVQQFLLPAARHLLVARQYAPTVARVHYRLAELSPVVPLVGHEVHLLNNTERLAPGDATLWFSGGLLHLNSGRIDDACRSWQQSLLLSRRHLTDIVQAAQGNLTVRQLLDQVLPRQADLLLLVARTYFGRDDQAQVRQTILQRADEAFAVTQLPPAEMLHTRAAILSEQGKQQEAVAYYADAVSRQSNNLTWRHEYARLLIDLEQFDQAQEHVAYLHTAAPESATYRQLLEEFNARRWRAGVPPSD